MQSTILHALPKFVPTTQRIQVCNGQYVAVLFVNTGNNRDTQTSI